MNDGEFSALLHLMMRRWPIFVLCLIGSLAATFLLYGLTDRMYEAEIIVQPAQDVEDTLRGIAGITGRLGALAGIGGLASAKGGRYDQTIALINSTGFFVRFDAITGFRHLLQERKRRQSTPETGIRDLLSVIEGHDLFHAEYLTIVEDPSTSVVWLRMRSWDPKLAADWLETTVTLVNEIVAQRELVHADNMLHVLNSELSKTQNVETQQAISVLIRRETEKRMMASVTKDYALVVIDHARPPAEEDFVSPDLAVYLLLGIVTGILVATVAIAVRRESGGASS